MGTGGTWFGFTGRQPSDIAGFGAVCGNRGRLSLARHGENPRVTLLVCAVEQMARVERLEEELGREQDRLRAMLSHLTQGASQGQV